MRRTICLLATCFGAAGCTQTMLKAEPRPGQLQPGQSVFVDDGTCPSGEVKKVTGGNRAAGRSRQTECVSRPAN